MTSVNISMPSRPLDSQYRSALSNAADIMHVMSERFAVDMQGDFIKIKENGSDPQLAINFTIKGLKGEGVANIIKEFFKEDALSKGYATPIIKTEREDVVLLSLNNMPEYTKEQMASLMNSAQHFQPHSAASKPNFANRVLQFPKSNIELGRN